jgi:hypothetical protein
MHTQTHRHTDTQTHRHTDTQTDGHDDPISPLVELKSMQINPKGHRTLMVMLKVI